MARKRKKANKKPSKYKASWWSSYLRLNLLGRRLTRDQQQRVKKGARSKNYWHQNSTLVFSKVDMLDAERFWLELNSPETIPVLKKVKDAHLFPLYKSGIWDGYAYFVEFKDGRKAAHFKNVMWNLRT